MNATVLSLTKVGAIVFYLVAAVSPVVPALAGYSSVLLAVAGILLLAHLVEYFAMRKRLEGVAPGPLGHFVGVLLFGFLYWLPLLKTTEK